MPAMLTKKDRNLELAHAVLAWNQRHLNKDATLTDEQLGECFAEQFVVEPNGRRYEATLSAYKEFLDGMRSTMTGIQYQVQHAVADDASVVFSMQVTIGKTDGTQERYTAMLLMQFDALGKVSLWHEVYVRTPESV